MAKTWMLQFLVLTVVSLLFMTMGNTFRRALMT